jgi:hypothetical protein
MVLPRVRHAIVTHLALQTMSNPFTTRPVVGGEQMGGEEARGQLSAAAPTRDGWLYVSGALTPYDLENLCDQIATLGRSDSGDVHVEVELGGAMRNSPELRTLARRMQRLRRQGVVVHVHAARGRVAGGGSSLDN